MHVSQGKEKFIDAWGQMGINWGINKTMGQIHALVLISLKPLCADDIMEALEISRGNAHQNIKTLLEWELIRGVNLEGERKDYFEADKDMWSAFTKIIKQRKKKELEPMLEILAELKTTECNCNESTEFCKIMEELHLFSTKADKALNNIVSSRSSWLIGNYLKAIR